MITFLVDKYERMVGVKCSEPEYLIPLPLDPEVNSTMRFEVARFATVLKLATLSIACAKVRYAWGSGLSPHPWNPGAQFTDEQSASENTNYHHNKLNGSLMSRTMFRCSPTRDSVEEPLTWLALGLTGLVTNLMRFIVSTEVHVDSICSRFKGVRYSSVI